MNQSGYCFRSTYFNGNGNSSKLINLANWIKNDYFNESNFNRITLDIYNTNFDRILWQSDAAYRRCQNTRDASEAF